MRRGLTTRVQKLEEVRTVAHQTCVLFVTQTLAEIAQGWDLFDSALARGMIPAECWAGERMLLILPEKVTDLDLWLAMGQSRQAWLDAHPGQRPGLRFVEDWELNRAKTLALQITEHPLRAEASATCRQGDAIAITGVTGRYVRSEPVSRVGFGVGNGSCPR